MQVLLEQAQKSVWQIGTRSASERCRGERPPAPTVYSSRAIEKNSLFTFAFCPSPALQVFLEQLSCRLKGEWYCP